MQPGGVSRRLAMVSRLNRYARGPAGVHAPTLPCIAFQHFPFTTPQTCLALLR